MKTLSIYRVNQPTTSGDNSISVTTTIFGTEEEIEYIRKSCEETIGSGLIQEYNSPLTSQFRGFNQGKVVPDVLQGWRYEEKSDFKKGYKQAILDGKTNYSRPQVTVFAENASKEEIEDFKQNCVTCNHFGECDGCERRNEE